jgi:hypothetical protein
MSTGGDAGISNALEEAERRYNGRMDRVCAACEKAIGDEEQSFRVREEYVHLACSEKYLKLASARPKAEAEALKKAAGK